MSVHKIKTREMGEIVDYTECSDCGATMPIHNIDNLFEAICFSPGCPTFRIMAGNIAVLKGEPVDTTPKRTIVIKDPIKPWSPCSGENCYCKGKEHKERP